MRVFLAIELSEDIVDNIYSYQNHIKQYSSRGSFTNKENFHITIKFIGEVNEKQLEDIKCGMDEISVDTFILETGRIGYFQRKDKKIIWVGVNGEIHKLNNLFKKVETIMESKGFRKEDRPYSPHITIGREVVLNNSLESIKKEININPRQFSVKVLSLMESSRENGKLVYKPIYRKSLLKT
ncbi:RNA 2',3'-cyclic phosphodiesterase [Alkalithermobacter paradoxus]|uniref:RNA 2',3'-cyclic phosphodiesterase n=1 Tax=Alkalithermobacter paradoxus TaxID=29349 RepID=A0A1V4I884_9FIRM|nr:2'-5'-RNA ligase [[Clostridium] thermoalcaliphilum]